MSSPGKKDAPASSVSPLASPRLPSPPPMAEVQFSHIDAATKDSSETTSSEQSTSPSAAMKIRPGTRRADIQKKIKLIPLADLDSPFQLQEHLRALHHDYTTDSSSPTSTSKPLTKETARILATPPDGVERNIWLYELCRLLITKTNELIVQFFSTNPPCSPISCPEMRASEWQYFCAVHDPPKSCPAIEYCCHTLDWAADSLSSTKLFPSRMSLSKASVTHLTNIFRRVYRIFAHAWFQHRSAYQEVETKTGLYVFYKTVCDLYALILPENYTIPQVAEVNAGIGAPVDEDTAEKPSTALPAQTTATDKRATVLLSSQNQVTLPIRTAETSAASSTISTSTSTAATTRRHKHTPSTGVHVSTIQEKDEDSEEEKHNQAKKLAASITEEGAETTEEAEEGREKEKTGPSEKDKTQEDDLDGETLELYDLSDRFEDYPGEAEDDKSEGPMKASGALEGQSQPGEKEEEPQKSEDTKTEEVLA